MSIIKSKKIDIIVYIKAILEYHMSIYEYDYIRRKTNENSSNIRHTQ